jgi:hypothetical protein
MVLQQEAPQQVLPAPAIAFVVQHQHPRGANALARVQHEMRALETGFHFHLALRIVRQFHRPRATPAEAHDHPLARSLDIEKGQHLA